MPMVDSEHAALVEEEEQQQEEEEEEEEAQDETEPEEGWRRPICISDRGCDATQHHAVEQAGRKAGRGAVLRRSAQYYADLCGKDLC